jgi:hypothetical protein
LRAHEKTFTYLLSTTHREHYQPQPLDGNLWRKLAVHYQPQPLDGVPVKEIIAVQISWMNDRLALILQAKMQPNRIFRKQVEADRERAEGWCFV